MDRSRLTELHYLTAPENLASIAERGLLCHRLAQHVPHVDLSSATIQDLRRGKEVAYAGLEKARKLHSYVNLFLHARNSMLKDVCHKHGHASVVVLSVSSAALDLPGAVLADQNAGEQVRPVPLVPGRAGSSRRGRGVSRDRGAMRWFDQIDYWRRKSHRSAELLIPDRVPAELIQGVYTSCTETSEQCESLGVLAPVSTDKDLFFL